MSRRVSEVHTDVFVDEEGRVLVAACPVGFLLGDSVSSTRDGVVGVGDDVCEVVLVVRRHGLILKLESC